MFNKNSKRIEQERIRIGEHLVILKSSNGKKHLEVFSGLSRTLDLSFVTKGVGYLKDIFRALDQSNLNHILVHARVSDFIRG